MVFLWFLRMGRVLPVSPEPYGAAVDTFRFAYFAFSVFYHYYYPQDTS